MNSQPESLNKRLSRFAVLIGVIFSITAAVVITQRLSQDSLALLVGLTCGVAAMLPTAALGFLMWRRNDQRQHAQQTRPAVPQQQPPVIVVTPQALPGYGVPRQTLSPTEQQQTWPWQEISNERRFTIVGGEE